MTCCIYTILFRNYFMPITRLCCMKIAMLYLNVCCLIRVRCLSALKCDSIMSVKTEFCFASYCRQKNMHTLILRWVLWEKKTKSLLFSSLTYFLAWKIWIHLSFSSITGKKEEKFKKKEWSHYESRYESMFNSQDTFFHTK